MLGSRLGPYQLTSLIGSGGMGQVYRAVDTRLGREVAVKVLPHLGTHEAEASERFRREARAASALSHPHVCAVYDFGEQDGRHFLVMELLEGQSLQEALQKGPFAPEQALRIVTDLVDALDAAHGKGIIHRDLKPANLFLTSRGRGKVLDFGVAKLVETSPDVATSLGLTQSGEAIGTIAYMSPEQARGQMVDARSDLFSIGLVLYEMLTGQPAVTGRTAAMLFDTLLHGEPPALRAVNHQIPASVEAIVSRLLAKAPSGRYQTARALLADLDVARRALESGSQSTASGSRDTRPSVAVLPFASLGSDPENEYLADGITEEVLGTLGRLTTLHVPGRVSCFAFKGRPVDVAEVATRLKVGNVLTGSVRRSGQRLRITAELVSADTGFQLWSARYDRTADDVFAIQDEIATSIAEHLKTTLSVTDRAPSVHRATANIDAYTAYWRGRSLLSQRGDGIKKGLGAFQEALALDPDLALGHAGLAEAYSLIGLYGYRPSVEVMPLAEAAAQRALELDASLSEPHAALMLVQAAFHWNWIRAEEEFDLAQAKHPNAAQTLTTRAIHLAGAQGRIEEALSITARAIDIDPLSPYSHYSRGQTLLNGRQYEAAIKAVDRALELYPDMWGAERVRGTALVLLGRHDEGIASCQRAVALSDRHPWTLVNLIDAHDLAGRTELAAECARDLLALAHERYVQPTAMAVACALTEGLDAAFAWLDVACRERDLLPLVNYWPTIPPLKRDPRWGQLMRRIGLEPAPID